MSLTFEFPGFHKQWDDDEKPDDQSGVRSEADDGWEADLQDLSGDAEDVQGLKQQCQSPCEQQPQQEQQQEQHQHDPSCKRCHAGAHAGSNSSQALNIPDAVLLLVVDRLALSDVINMTCVCKSWHECIITSSVWEEQYDRLLGRGWPWAPFVGSKPIQLPPSLTVNGLLQLQNTLRISKVGLQFFVMRKGFEFLLSGFEALWAALEPPPAAAAAAGAAAGSQQVIPSPLAKCQSGRAGAGRVDVQAAAQPESPESAAAATAAAAAENFVEQSDDLQQQRQLALTGGRQLQRLVDKLALHNWQLTYLAYSTALAARCEDIAQQLKDWSRQQHHRQLLQPPLLPQPQPQPQPPLQQQQHEESGAVVPDAAGGDGVLSASVLADCAGGILSDIEAVSGGLAAGELLAAEPELLLAATRRGVRPVAAIQLWLQLLTVWERYRRWLDLVTARCGLLGARVAAARQLAEPSSRGPPNAALLPHLRNKGLLLFRGHVLLAYGLRRPLQEAALWLAAAAAVDGAAWRAGGGCSESELDVLVRVRKLLTELDVADGQDEDASKHTHAKFRRCFGALLTRERRSRCLPASAW